MALMQQHLIDSTKLSTIDSTRSATKTAFERRQKLEKDSMIAIARRSEEILIQEADVRRRRTDKAVLQSAMQQYDTELMVQQVKLEDLKKPKFLRTPEEKESALREQLNTIQQLTSTYRHLQDLVNTIDKGGSYELPELYKKDSISN